jgi:hypothetical protein
MPFAQERHGPLFMGEGKVARQIWEMFFQQGMNTRQIADAIGHKQTTYVAKVVAFYQRTPMARFWQRLEEIESLLLEQNVMLRQLCRLPQSVIDRRVQELLKDEERRVSETTPPPRQKRLLERSP